MSDNDASRLTQPADGPEATRSGRSPPGLLAWLPWIAAAGFALLTGFLVQIHYATQAELITMREQAALAGIEARSLQQQMEAERILSARRVADLLAELPGPGQPRVGIVPLVSRTDGTPSAMAVAVWSPGSREGELVAVRLPATAPEKSYQLWITVPGDPLPVSAGTFSVEPTATTIRMRFTTDRVVPAGAAFAISVEHAGGAQGVEGPIILSSQ